jgi:ribulose-phosphate 3-epimerase
LDLFLSLFTFDELKISESIYETEKHADGFHLDIMDGKFVENLFGDSNFINSVKKETRLPISVHLMVNEPQEWVDRLELSPKDLLIFHSEASSFGETKKNIELFKNKGCQVGVAFNPETPINEDLLEYLDAVLVMSVKPGMSGQKFIEPVLEKIEKLLKYRKNSELQFLVIIDGGVDKNRIEALRDAGVDRVVVGSAVFCSNNPKNEAQGLHKLANNC